MLKIHHMKNELKCEQQVHQFTIINTFLEIINFIKN